ncbi:YetF domain-containing protein [Paenibacillus sp. R14(2021)]|uniref:YetF domain-containing protein n=1 Tax=Paenibacillus sp. R14(2021) TaxID=2859228 RepID=UPI001C614B48
MTIATTVIMISLGTTIVQPIAKLVIQNGQIVQKNLKSCRMTVDQLETRLRQLGVSTISDVKTATLEPNGQVGYEFMQHAKPLTVGDLERILGLKPGGSMGQSNLFQEVITNHHSSPIDPKLQ